MDAASSGTVTPKRTGSAGTRAAIQLAAAALFAEQGFSDTSVRDIARAAGTDPALVIRYFKSKEALFLDTMSLDGEFSQLLDGPLNGLGAAVVERLLARSGLTRNLYVALQRAADRPEVRAYLGRMTERHLVAALVPRLEGPNPRLRAHLVAAAIGGLLNALWNVEDEVLVSAPTPDLVHAYGAVLQMLIDGD